MRTYRSMTLEGQEIEFSDGFTDLHTTSYNEIIKGNGFTVKDALPSIEIAYEIRKQTPVGLKGNYHPFAAVAGSKHPFEL
jgi:UDP-N-acetyl-2-amino-2-deoxyglucuronate dehydrogenase